MSRDTCHKLHCDECEAGHVSVVAAADRWFVVTQQVQVELPCDLLLPTCDHCGSFSVPEEMVGVVAVHVRYRLICALSEAMKPPE